MGYPRRAPRIALFCGAVFCTAVLCAPAARAVEATLVADAHVDSARPTVNCGSLSNLNIGAGYTSLLQFDLSLLPAATTSAQVSRAILRVYVNQVNTAGLVSLQPVNGAWTESSLTYANLPTLGPAAQVVSVTQSGVYVAVDVTALVQGWIANPSSNYGLALSAATASLQLDSKENDQTAHPAVLDIGIVSQGPAGPAGPQGAAGTRGANGANGAAGPAGPTGATGLTGLQGLTGPAGPQGIQGPTGPGGTFTAILPYLGPYASTTNYAVNDIVSFQGSSYVSLIASNHGNTPSFSPTQWGVLAQGGTGPQGPAGATGATGQQGPPGFPGTAGPQGPPGATGALGPQGLPGLNYQGAYQSTVNYTLGDVVLWQGTTYSSLQTSNHGNTPDASPTYWGVLSERGPAGPTGAAGNPGPTGAPGPPGSVGPPGERGDQGLQGIPGQAGAQGIPGATGAQGLSGPMGPQGVPGPTGLSFQGVYRSSTNYNLADGVLYNGQGYVSLTASNHGNTPDQSPAAWSLFAAAGSAGATGPIGLTGPQGTTGTPGAIGPQGPQGATGATGPQGPPVVNYTGNYASATNYALHDGVSYNGSSYVSLVASNHGNTPDQSPAYWAVLAAQGLAGPAGTPGTAGSTGATGPQGAQGPAGPQGPPLTYAGGWLAGTTYPLGTIAGYLGSSYVALSTNTGRQPDISPIYWGPIALAGPTGASGPAGATGAAGQTGATGPQGAAGPAGPSGPTGGAATVAVGTVTTGTAGSLATVTNSGSATNAVFDFTIPQGANGTNGTGSGSGSAQTLTGIPFLSTVHAVSFNTAFYALNGPAATLSESPTVLTWVPTACTASRLVAYSMQQNTIDITLRVGASPTTMAASTLSCSVAPSSSCTGTASVAIAAGSFVDLAITGANGTTSSVWTALECD